MSVTRLLIRLRWAMVVLASLAGATFVASGWWYANWYSTATTPETQFAIVTAFGGVRLESYPALDKGWAGEFRGFAFGQIRRPEWRLGFDVHDHRGSGTSVYCPLWVVALTLAVIAGAGFRAERRQVTPGQCRSCHHPLAGASTCPECGRRTEVTH